MHPRIARVIGMENIINRIIDIDRRAQQKYIDADGYRKQAEADIEQGNHQLDEQLAENSEEKLQAVKDTQQAIVRERAEALAQHLNEQKEALNRTYETNHAEWEKDLLQKILG